ncbi:calcium-binding protein [Pseudovibrio sp. Alg231-02]|uniref:calcium-binding protein n=1 Tax=Pseudovibrio sp. Alg231-02 TaxID=1922223 RepID=UPI000D560D3A|nr:calcium-binding protein [Pseudovibrio sp. Alg231-02]
MPIFSGTDQSETIIGTHGDDAIYGEGGDDILRGGLGDDYIFGGNGNNLIEGGDGNDVIYAGIEDRIYGGAGDDIIRINGNDDVNAGTGSDIIYVKNYSARDGNFYRNKIDGAGGVDLVSYKFFEVSVDIDLSSGRTTKAGSENIWERDELVNIENAQGTNYDDVIRGNNGDNSIWGEQGDDVIRGGGGNDYLHGGLGDDLVIGGAGDDRLRGGKGDDVLYGYSGNDRLEGEDGDDVIHVLNNDGDAYQTIINGGAGSDEVYFSSPGPLASVSVYLDLGQARMGSSNYALISIEKIHGTNGYDYIRGNASGSTLFGRGGHDTILGEGGNDTIHGGSGNDLLLGGTGQDVLIGGAGKDTLIGGLSDDVFLFQNIGTGSDLIKDFEKGDVIDISDHNETSGWQNIDDVLEHSRNLLNGDVVIELGDDVIQIKGWALNELTEDMFIL